MIGGVDEEPYADWGEEGVIWVGKLLNYSDCISTLVHTRYTTKVEGWTSIIVEGSELNRPGKIIIVVYVRRRNSFLR